VLGKIKDLEKELKVSLQAFVAVENDMWRKPSPKIWTFWVQKFNPLNSSEDSFFVGDAAGRSLHFYDDFSCGDYGFALNAHIPFFTPEHFFNGQKLSDCCLYFHPQEYIERASSSSWQFPLLSSLEIVVLVGYPGSGKSTFFKNYFSSGNYTHINQDTLKTFNKCLSETEKSLRAQKSCVIDNTNGTREKRAHFVQLARKYNAKIRCFVMEACQNPLLAHHLNGMRGFRGERYVPEIAFRVFKYEPVTPEEGFDHVENVPFLPHFDNEKEKEEFCMNFVAEKK